MERCGCGRRRVDGTMDDHDDGDGVDIHTPKQACTTYRGKLRTCVSAGVSDHAETYRRTWCRSRSGTDRWLRFTPCVDKLVGVAGGGTPTSDAVTAAGRMDASGKALLSLSCGSVLIQSSMDVHQVLGLSHSRLGV
jgi:hypothetical protein